MNESNGSLALWRLQTLEIVFGIVHCPRFNTQAADAGFCIPKMNLEPVDVTQHLNEDIPTYCILCQKSHALCATGEDRVIHTPMAAGRKYNEGYLREQYKTKVIREGAFV